MLFIILLVLLVALVGGGWGYSRWGYVGISPAVVLLLILVVLYFTGHLHFR